MDGQILVIGNPKLSAQIVKLEIPARQIDGRIGQVDSRVNCAGFGELDAVGAHAASNFQNSQILSARKICRGGNMPFLVVSMGGHALKKLASPVLSVAEFCAA